MSRQPINSRPERCVRRVIVTLGGTAGLATGILDCFRGESSFLPPEGILACLMGSTGLSGLTSSGLAGRGGLGGGPRSSKLSGRAMYDGLGGTGGRLGGMAGLAGS